MLVHIHSAQQEFPFSMLEEQSGGEDTNLCAGWVGSNLCGLSSDIMAPLVTNKVGLEQYWEGTAVPWGEVHVWHTPESMEKGPCVQRRFT